MTRDKLIVALDVNTPEAAGRLVDELASAVRIFKIGFELFTAAGPDIVRRVHERGAKVFLDLKFHDIPNTVAGAVKSAAKLGVFMCNVHALGGRDMLKAAAEAKRSAKSELHVIAVTVLTSMNQASLEEIGIGRALADEVILLAKTAQAAGLSGVVASGLEAPQIREACGKDFLIVTPGVRPDWAAKGDQRRVLTPQAALEAGADYLVVGRPITADADPPDAARRILAEMQR